MGAACSGANCKTDPRPSHPYHPEGILSLHAKPTNSATMPEKTRTSTTSGGETSGSPSAKGRGGMVLGGGRFDGGGSGTPAQ